MPTARQTQLHNLPAGLSDLIGRQSEIAEVKRLLRETRLLTLTGPGGCGKTRLALAVSQALLADFADGVNLVEFAPLADPALVPQAVAKTLRIHEQPGQSLTELLTRQFERRQTLLVFDNCEHLAEACAHLGATLLRACPHLRLLATSRETLNVAGEMIWVVPPLSLPDPQPWRGPESAQRAFAAYQQSEAVRLFIVRAAAGSPGFTLTVDNAPWVAEICRRLDGMPLAIELAAARVRALPVQEIAARLEDRFQLLSSGSRTAPARHQSLAATLDWSYALLDEPERKLLLRLSVFAGGFALAAAEAICPDGDLPPADVLNTLSSLVDKSLVQPDQAEGEGRYRLLETIRQYSARRLVEAGEEAQWRDRHLAYFITWAKEAEPQLTGSGYVAWLGRYEREHDNLRVALAWAQNNSAQALQGLQLASYCALFWRRHGYHTEGRMRLSAALAQRDTEQAANAPARASVLYWAALFAFFQSDYSVAQALLQDSQALYQAMGQAGRAGVADALELLAEVATEQGRYAAARLGFEEALAIYRELGQTNRLADTQTMLGWLAMRTGDYEGAAGRLDEALANCRAIGDEGYLAQALAARGELALRQGEYRLAATFLEESLALRRRIGEAWGIAISLGSLGWAALRQRSLGRARELLGESLTIRMESGDIGGSAWCLERLAEAALPAGGEGARRAAILFGAAAALRARVNAVVDGVDQPEYERHLAALRARLGEDPFAAAWAEGGAMSLEQAAEYALAQPAERPVGASNAEPLGGLTARERQVVALIAQGQSNRQIAETLIVNVRTVETYVTRILGKLDFTSRVHIATWAIEKGLARPDEP